MPGLSLSIKLIGAEQLIKKLGSKTIKEPLDKGIKRIALKMESLTKQATVVGKTGFLKSSVTHSFFPDMAKIGSRMEYASFVEYGTQKMEARHMEGGRKVLGKGMFTYALELLKSWLGKGEHGIHKDIEAKFEE